MFESILSWLAYFPHHYWHRGEEAARVGMRHHFMTPYGPYLASDKVYVSVAVATPQDWEVFCRGVIERPELLEDPRFQTSENRRKNRVILEKLLEELFQQRPHDEWLERLEKTRLPHGLVRGIGEVLAHPQVAARKLIREAESPVGKVPVIANALKMSASESRYDRIPALGENNDAILSEIGYDAGQIADLRRDKVI